MPFAREALREHARNAGGQKQTAQISEDLSGVGVWGARVGYEPDTSDQNHEVLVGGVDNVRIWELPDGTVLEAGALSSDMLSSEGFEAVDFDAGFETAPVTLSQVQTVNGTDFVTTRQDGATADGFQVTMQEEEAKNDGGHTTKIIGWVAIEAGSGSAGGIGWIAGQLGGVTDDTATVDLAASLTGGANAIAGLSTFNGSDTAWARGDGSRADRFDVSVEEEQNRNDETNHIDEIVDYFAFSGAGTLSGTPVAPAPDEVLETDTVTLTHRSTTVTLQHDYDNPVVTAYVATENGTQPVNVRVSNIDGNDLTLQLQEPDDLDGGHTSETVNYIVVEAGTWVLPGDTILEAGALDSDKLSSEGFEAIGFDAGVETAPVTLSQVQTVNGTDFVTTRQDGVTAVGFQVTMQEQESKNDGGRKTETIGWIAIKAGSGSADGFEWIAGQTGGVTNADATVDIGAGLAADANVVAPLSTFNGSDPAWARGNGSDGDSFDVSVEEDQSRDSETNHTAEGVDYFVFNEAGVVSGYEYEYGPFV